jgi:hypothetical protein
MRLYRNNKYVDKHLTVERPRLNPKLRGCRLPSIAASQYGPRTFFDEGVVTVEIEHDE